MECALLSCGRVATARTHTASYVCVCHVDHVARHAHQANEAQRVST